jgi:hypothetical protein
MDSKVIIPFSLKDDFLGKPVTTRIFEFSWILAIAIIIICCLNGYIYSSFIAALATLILTIFPVIIAKKFPILLLPAWFLWMKLAMVLNKIMTPVILTILWTLVVIPIGFLLKVLGKRTLDMTYKQSGTVSYWKDCTAVDNDVTKFKRQF